LSLLGLLITAILASAHTTVTIPADDHVTVLTLTLRQGDKVDYSYTAQGPVAFEIQLVGGSEQMAISGLSGSGQFEALYDGTFSFRFENQNSDVPVNVSYAIERAETSVGFIILVVFGLLAVLTLVAVIAYMVLREQRRSGQPPVR